MSISSHQIVALAALFVAFQLITIGLTLKINGDTAAQANRTGQLARSNRRAIHALRHVAVVQCQAAQPFRVQSRTRARIEADLLAGIVRILPPAPVAQTEPQLTDLLVRIYKQDLRRLIILPVPDCHHLRVALRHSLLIHPPALGGGQGHHVSVRRLLRRAINETSAPVSPGRAPASGGGSASLGSAAARPSAPPPAPAGGGGGGGHLQHHHSPPSARACTLVPILCQQIRELTP